MLIFRSIEFVRGHGRFLTTAVLLVGVAGFGNTFFIGLFGDEIRQAFAISHGEFGLVYTMASVLCGLSLTIAGRPVDRVSFRAYTLVVALTLVVGILMVATAADIVLFGLALYLVRLAGPGLMNHSVLVATARTFSVARGRAVAMVLMGQPLSEALLPFLAVSGIALIGWRETWLLAAGIVALAVPLSLRWARAQVSDPPPQTHATATPATRTDTDWTTRRVLVDWRFHAITFALLWNVTAVSGLFFHQAHVALVKGWTLDWVAGCFVAFAIAKVAGIVVTGAMADRIGSSRMVALLLVPVSIGLVALAMGDQREMAIIYFAGAGLSMGAGFTLNGTIWAEIYGIARLGAVRSLSRSITFPASALAPAALGLLFDIGVSLPTVAWGLILCMVVASILSTCVMSSRQRCPDV